VGGLKRWLAGVVLALEVHAASAADAHPLDIPLRDYLLVLAVSVGGGLVSWYGRVRRGEASAWSLVNAIGETCTSAMAGLLVFWIARYMDTPELLTIALVGIAGHMGGRAISTLEDWAQHRIGITKSRGEQ
jgi:hypothetical protein